MQIGTDPSQIAALTGLFPTGTGTSAGGAAQTSSPFGPSSILSLGGGLAATNNTYTDLAAMAILGGSPAAPSAQSQQLNNTEKAALKRAFALIDDRQLDEAESTLKDILRGNRSSASVVHALGIVEHTRGDLEKAEALFRRADYLAPTRGYRDDADNARLLQEDDATVVEKAAELMANSNTQDRATRLLLHVTERSPAFAGAKIELGKGLISQGDLLGGISNLLTASAIGDEDDNAKIEKVAEELVELLPTAPQARRLLGRAQNHLGKYEEALVSLNTATDLSGSDLFHASDLAAAKVGIGRDLLAQGDFMRALSHFKEAKELDRFNADVGVALGEGHLAKANRLRSLGDLSGSIKSYADASTAIGSNGSDTLRRRVAASAWTAGIRMEQKNIAAGDNIDEEALAFQAAYNMDRDNLAYKRKLAEIRTTSGDQSVADGEFVDAIGSYRRAYDLYEGNTTYRDNLVNAHTLRGDELMSEYKYTEAIAAYDEGYRVYTNDEAVTAGLADAYNARGADYISKNQPLQALDDIKAALALFPDNATYLANYELVKAYDPDYEA